MKRKFFSVLLALVLVLSFSLIPAAPVMAATIDLEVNDENPWTDGAFTFENILPGGDPMAFNFKLHNVGDDPGILTFSMSVSENDMAGAPAPNMSADEFASLIYVETVHYQYIWLTDPEGPYIGSVRDDLPGWLAMDFNEDGKVSLYEICQIPEIPYGDYEGDQLEAGAEITYFIEFQLGGSLEGGVAGGAILTDVENNSSQGDGVSVTIIATLETDIEESSGNVFQAFGVAGPVLNSTTDVTYGTIQEAIDAASPGDTIIVAAGTYTQDLTIPATKTNLELTSASGAAVTTIKGVLEQDWPTHTPAIDILASGVKIHGFTIESPSYSRIGGNPHSSGITVGATNVEIYENEFKSVDDGTGNSVGWCTMIETYGQWVPDVSGLYIHDNSFTSTTGTDKGSEGIFINYNLNNPTPAGTVTIENNTFGGQIFRAIATERSRTTIRGNTINSSFAAGAAWNAAYLGIYVSGPALNLNTVVVMGNDVVGFFYGMFIATSGSAPSNTSVHKNTVNNNTMGIWVRSSANDIAVHHNTVSSNTAEGIRVDGDSNSIHHNTVTNNTGYGIHLTGTSDDNSVHHNTLSGNDEPIRDEGTDNKVFRN